MFEAGWRPWSLVEAILLRVGGVRLAGKGRKRGGTYRFEFAASSPILGALRAALAQEGIEFHEVDAVELEADDLRDCPLLVLVAGATGGYGGLGHYGNVYDFASGCSRCGTGSRRTSPLILDAAAIRSRGDSVKTAQGEFLVSPLLRHLLEEGMVTGMEFSEVRSRRGQSIPWFQLRPIHSMPPATTFDGEREDQCPKCLRDGHYDRLRYPFSLGYDADQVDLAGLPEIVATWECFGPSRLGQTHDNHMPGACIAQPRLLVKPRVREIVERHRMRVGFSPVRLLECPS